MRTAVIAVVLGVIILVVFLGSQQRRANERREREERVEKVVPELMLLDNKCVELAGRGDLTLEWTGNRDIKSDERQAVEAAQAKLAKVTADIPTLRAWLAEVAAFCSRAVDPREGKLASAGEGHRERLARQRSAAELEWGMAYQRGKAAADREISRLEAEADERSR